VGILLCTVDNQRYTINYAVIYAIVKLTSAVVRSSQSENCTHKVWFVVAVQLPDLEPLISVGRRWVKLMS
jgi:hypothetical protein